MASKLIERIKSAVVWAAMFVLALWLAGWGRALLMEPADHRLPPVPLHALADGQAQTVKQDRHQLLYLFAPWCQICEFTFSHIGLWQQQGRAVSAIALDYQSIAEVNQFVDRNSDVETSVLVADPAWSKHLGVVAFPTYLIVDSNGEVIAKRVGYLPEWALSLYLDWYGI